MSTTGPNLEPGRKALEKLMDDACTILRDPQGVTDDTFDQATGLYTPPINDVATVYTGKCLVTTQSNIGREGSRGGGTFQVVTYKIQLPVAAPPLKLGDWVRITASRRDPANVGKRFQVEHPTFSTLAMTRAATLRAEELVV